MNTRLVVAASFFAAAFPGLAQHPTTARSQQAWNSNQRVFPQQQGTVTKADVSAGIRKYISDQSAKSSDKKMHVPFRGKDLALDLVKVHDDRLSSLGNGKYFACVDMRATNGNVYDLDFFVTGNAGDMRITDAFIHKINGKPLYDWKEQNGVWKKVSI
jgi:hypothetical protein